MKKIIIFLGAPGSGKGTQARIIEEEYGYGHFSTGDLLREMAKNPNLKPEEKELLDAVTRKGQLAPDSLIFKLAFEAMDKIFAGGNGVVLDGAIRTLEQAKGYQKYFTEKKLNDEVVVVEVAIPDEESYRRLAHRRTCGQCGDIVTLHPKESQICSKCGGKLLTRPDDSHEIVTKRIEIQGNKAIAPIRNYYKDLGILKIVDGTKSVKEVEEEIRMSFKKHYAHKVA